jgi:hypothetical protein
MSAEPVLNPEIFASIKTAGISLYAAFKIVAMHSFRPSLSNFLDQAAASERQPRLVKPHATFVSV